LTIWHFDHGHHDLFSALPSNKAKVAIDTNVFLDLTCPEREHHQIAQGLTEGWLDDVFELVVTPEIFNDVDRCSDDSQRALSRAQLQNYKVLRALADPAMVLAAKLSLQYPDLAKNERGNSDIKHLAYCVVEGIRYFVTRDDAVLELSAEFLQNHDLLVLSPVELISQHDAIEREAEYQPRRLVGTGLTSAKLKADQLGDLVEVFRYKAAEKANHFRSIINDLLATPRGKHVQLLQDQNDPLVLIGYVVNDDRVAVQLLRMSSHPLAPTVVRHSLMELIHSSVSDSRVSITISDTHLGTEVTSALKELGFVFQAKQWIKPLLNGFIPKEQIATMLQGHGISNEEWSADELETLIWPAKRDSDEAPPCYLIPIQAQWAEHFFDVDLASQRLPELSDIRTELHLGVEAVYYSGSRNKFVTPGHILWYVSLGAEGMGSMTIKATSRLRGVVRAKPKELFKQFQRLGVYQWKQVYEAAGKDITRELIALRFSHTERFARPVSKQQLADLGVRGNLQGPMSIHHQTFKEIYRQGTTL
jgi:predicted nucleic acid-binding protein